MKVDFKKYSDGLVPAIVQDYLTQKVLMLGFMNEEALKKTEETGLVTFYSRSKKRLWTKGEESHHHLQLRQILVDCEGGIGMGKTKNISEVLRITSTTGCNNRNGKSGG